MTTKTTTTTATLLSSHSKRRIHEVEAGDGVGVLLDQLRWISIAHR